MSRISSTGMPFYRFSRYGAGLHHWPHGFDAQFTGNPDLNGWMALWTVTLGRVLCDVGGETRLCLPGDWYIWRFNAVDGGFRNEVSGAPMGTAWVFFRQRQGDDFATLTHGHVDDVPFWTGLFRRCEASLRRENPELAWGGSTWLESLLLECGENRRGEIRHTPFHFDALLRDIRSSPGAAWTTRRMADILGLSPRLISKVCRETYGCTARELLLKTRLEAAIDMLELTDLPLKQVARNAGFCDQSALSHALSKHTGASPRRWR